MHRLFALGHHQGHDQGICPVATIKLCLLPGLRVVRLGPVLQLGRAPSVQRALQERPLAVRVNGEAHAPPELQASDKSTPAVDHMSFGALDEARPVLWRVLAIHVVDLGHKVPLPLCVGAGGHAFVLVIGYRRFDVPLEVTYQFSQLFGFQPRATAACDGDGDGVHAEPLHVSIIVRPVTFAQEIVRKNAEDQRLEHPSGNGMEDSPYHRPWVTHLLEPRDVVIILVMALEVLWDLARLVGQLLEHQPQLVVGLALEQRGGQGEPVARQQRDLPRRLGVLLVDGVHDDRWL